MACALLQPRFMVDDFGDEDTAPWERTPLPAGKRRPRYELVWVEESGMDMVLQVRRVTDDVPREDDRLPLRADELL